MKLTFLPLLLVGLTFSNCATILSSSKQKVTFTSNLPNAKVYVNDNLIGNTPWTARIKKKKTNVVRFQHEQGSTTAELKGKFMGGYIFIDLLFGGTVGIIVDAATNSWLRYPKTLHADIPQSTPAEPVIPVAAPVAIRSTLSTTSVPESAPNTSMQSRSDRPGSPELANSGTSHSPQQNTNSTNSRSGDDPFGLKLKKLILEQLFNELPQKGMPSAANPTDSSKVYVFLVGKKNVSTYTTDILPVSMYSDSTWPSAKDTRQRFAHSLGLPIHKVVLAGYFTDSLVAQKAWATYQEKIAAYEINRFAVAFDVNPDTNPLPPLAADLSTGIIVSKPKGEKTQIVNLPAIEITGKYRPNLGIMPVIDTKTNLNQQFLIHQYLRDNPLVINNKDTLQSSLTDYRAHTQFAVGGTMNEDSYRLKLWQKEKFLAEIVIPFTSKTTLEERMTLIGKQIGRILSSNTDNYIVQEHPRTQGLYDQIDVIQSEIRKGTEISRLFPDVTTHYLPPGLSLPAPLSHLSNRSNNLPYLKNATPNGIAQTIRGIYQQTDEKQFFFTNGNIPQDMKDAVRRITQPTSRRIGAALSYIAAGDAFRENENNLDGAASSYYSALLLSHNLAASTLEKAAVKQLVYQRMNQVASVRKQPYLSGLFELAADLNSSYLASPLASQSHQEYYTALQNTAKLCQDAEKTARSIRAQERTNALMAVGALAGAAVTASKTGGTLTSASIQQLTSQLEGAQAVTSNMRAAVAESLKDVAYENFEVRDESGTEVELNKLYLNLEILWHLGVRPDRDVVGKRLLAYAKDKPALKVALEEYLAETDDNQQKTAIGEFQSCFQHIEVQANRYESWGMQLPKKVVGRF
ncbi:PEGA domain-containing protein [Larkinella sp. GY13]|uniref:PEGA domain-containing protein n=1 Tax=Larkinella sp. GY13 TaxID=3453720 RepID=UPI003EE8F0C4